jgi:hypothetical protein
MRTLGIWKESSDRSVLISIVSAEDEELLLLANSNVDDEDDVKLLVLR